ncbi:transporter associated domain-containing protein [Cypionkella sp.]|uniref:transporter associated domain-containing protein n=1 Tax=Cypionkella sp. TaxID=2811411 RepID=UPI002AB90F4F|nr:transporter associated domain-containing protein [Cypionkella sp.]MDZ4393766.1 transporter associated domain-containing protein [Cypionkella sp.]
MHNLWIYALILVTLATAALLTAVIAAVQNLPHGRASVHSTAMAKLIARGEMGLMALRLAHSLTALAALSGLLWQARDWTGFDFAWLTFTAGIALALLGRIIPSAIGTAIAECTLARLGLFGLIAAWIFTPLAALMQMLKQAALRGFGLTFDLAEQHDALRDDIAGAIALGHSGGAMQKEDRDRLLGALDLSDRAVEEIMRHRRQIEMINADDPPGEIVSQMLASPHSRLPVYRDETENILGVVHTKDLLRELDRLLRGDAPEGLESLDILKVAKKPYFIPNTTNLDEQMREFLKRRTHFALVVDEYGALQGLITLEDILEEIVGDITDEFDVVARDSGLKRDGNGDYLIDGAMTIRDLNRATDWQLPDAEANTIAGLVIHEAQMIPSEGQVFHFHGFRIEVAQRRENRLTKLKLRPVTERV